MKKEVKVNTTKTEAGGFEKALEPLTLGAVSAEPRYETTVEVGSRSYSATASTYNESREKALRKAGVK